MLIINILISAMCMSVIIHESPAHSHAEHVEASCSRQRCWALLCRSATVIVLNHCYAANISLTVALHSPQSKHEDTVEYRDAVARSCEVHVSFTKLWKVFLTRDTKLTTRWGFLYRPTQQPCVYCPWTTSVSVFHFQPDVLMSCL